MQMEDSRQLYTLGEALDDDLLDSAVLLPENRLQDLTDEELAAFEHYSSLSRDERGIAYGEWFTKRILEMDTRYGQLASAYELSQLAIKCLSGWSAQETKTQFDEFFLHTERLYKCVYPLQLSACCLLPLNEWTSMSMQEQAMVVIGIDGKGVGRDVAAIVERLELVFVAQRGDRIYSLDNLFTWLAKEIISKPSLTNLSLSAALLYQSNPSLALKKRWIQSDARLIETALDVVYAVDVAEVLGAKAPSEDEDAYMQRHLTLVEQMWTIFQSLPVRKENDPPDVSQLQVAVDEMEDLMVTMDVLSRYGIVASPSGLKYKLLASAGVGADAGFGAGIGPRSLLEQMCEFALPGGFIDDEGSSDGNQWQEVLQDAVRLKEHAFGERLSQETILEVILKQLLNGGLAYADAAQDFVNHWIASDVEAVDHVLVELLMSIRAKLDSVSGYSEDTKANAVHEAALHCIGIARQLLSLPLWDEGDRAVSGSKRHYEEALALETDGAHACELLDLLTYGAVKLSPAKFRIAQSDEEEDGNARLDAVFQVFVSNPSNYKVSVRAREWLAQHGSGTESEAKTDKWDEPLAAVLHLAKLLRVDSRNLEIWMKGAYAALYCMDYDVAYDLTMQVIDGIPNELDSSMTSRGGGGGNDKLTLVHLISLVLDLVSASSFRSWSKKRKLCCALLSSPNASSFDLFAHQVTDLVVSWLEKIEAIQSLMTELGLSDDDLEQRRVAGSMQITSSVDVVLLNELKMVVDLLHEEKNDRQFLLRLLQRGLQLLQAMDNTDDNTKRRGTSELAAFLQQMAQLCVEEAVELTSASSEVATVCGDWQQYLELGFSYLVLWGELCLDDDSFETFYADKILPLAFSQQPGASSDEAVCKSEAVVRRFHHFFLLQVALATEHNGQDELEGIMDRRKHLETLSSDYEAVRQFIGPHNESQKGSLSKMSGADGSIQPTLVTSKQRYQVLLLLAQQCQERLATQKKSQELEQMSSFFNTELDLERFSQDVSYRNETIMMLATKKEHLQVSRQFANKYGVDEYACVLAYIKHVLLSPLDSSPMSRHEQLDQAFRSEQVDILEEALQRPFAFGDFLIGNGAAGEVSIYDSLDGTDHVGLLLVLRMVLECQKRVVQQTTESASPHEMSFFPLSKPSTDRITLLFMCLKKLKEISDSLTEVAEAADFKLIGAALTTAELLTPLAAPHTDPRASMMKREVAVEAVRPLLSGKTIKLVTKILRKLYRVTPSAMVMIYISDLLSGIWREHGATGTKTAALSADLAAYAYESCVPCLSVLSNEHLMLFHYLFLDGSSDKSLPELVAHLNIGEEFYGQSLSGLQNFGALLSAQKRVEVVADTLRQFQTKYKSWQTSGSRSNVSSASSTSSTSSVSWDPAQSKRKEQELRYLERKLSENVCFLLLSEIQQHGLLFNDAGTESTQSLKSVIAALKTWFAMDPMQQASNQEEILHKPILIEICQRVASVDLATFVMEIVMRAGGNIVASEDMEVAIVRSYETAVANLIDQCLGRREGEPKQAVSWLDRLAWTWATGANPATSSNTAGSGRIAELERYLRSGLSSYNSEQTNSRTIYQRTVTIVAQSPSLLLKEIATPRLEELQAQTTAASAKRVRDALVIQWKSQISLRETQQEWVEAALLSHVLATSYSTNETLTAKWDFGLRMKAVWSVLLTKHKLEKSSDCPRVLEVPTHDIFDQFNNLFEEVLVFVEARSSDRSPKALRFAEQATVALSNLLVCYDGACSVSEQPAAQSSVAWQDEQNWAVHARIQAQFKVSGVTKKPEYHPDGRNAACWSALLSRGHWGAHLLSWYTADAYAKLSCDANAIEAAVLAHWEANSIDVAVQLLLMCPFDALREKYVSRLLSDVRQLPQGSRVWATAMELVLLRFDVCVLLQHGLHSSLVAFLLHNTKSKESTLWTSSGDYVVCALVMQGEFAAAGRLTCALRHSHLLLWDVENARLLVANYLRALSTSTSMQSDAELGHLQHEVFSQAFHHFASAIM
ncbi:hypothetical protein PHYBOEH_005042 [Phytophthora boehmeriae]|uniref:Uncharacterized protein n=1 Tax=Phytophthora boehmeriae TaxID=109152 RepID=A0A8T1WRY6_9STRA|nr:hypothetical protein PHYBOEH_005042 [Phytophthora boehmeriae]